MAKKTTKKRTKKIGRPTSFRSKYIDETRKLANLGIPEEKIAWYIGVHPNTFRTWKKKYDDLLAALEQGKAKRDVALTTALFENATRRHNPSVQIFLAKNWLGMSDRQEISLPDLPDDAKDRKITVVHVNGDRAVANKKKKK